MKKFIALLTALVLVMGLCACGSKSEAEPQSLGMPNPLTEVTAQELCEKTGMSFAEPEGAQDVRYFTLEAEKLTAQMTFTLDGKKVTCRALPDVLPENGQVRDISGMYCEWKVAENGKVGYNDAIFRLIEGQQGHVSWYDYVPGITYNVSVDTGASVAVLKNLAEKSCPPLQGDA